ncbi:hypothetical protein [Aureispira sp. CCB-QB1]|uniref:hypothetical protein n=1 Tax=Aureispira sp. CCB-QB1 TaxID=1313421 RepID=UPI0007C6B4D8|nr:hypothetical protein [Aureispira sp. CCB-QB1]
MTQLYSSIYQYCQELEQSFGQIINHRQQQLLRLSTFLKEKIHASQTPDIIAICTHNSRRSHLAQIWLAIAADYYQTPSIRTFSGGTEATAFNHRTVAALQQIGLKITTDNTNLLNPVYQIRWNDSMPPYLAFSKQYEAPPNPRKDFAALVVCSHADIHCPIVFGSALKIALPYADPKAFDGTDLEAVEYLKTCRLIALEMLFVLKQITL